MTFLVILIFDSSFLLTATYLPYHYINETLSVSPLASIIPRRYLAYHSRRQVLLEVPFLTGLTSREIGNKESKGRCQMKGWLQKCQEYQEVAVLTEEIVQCRLVTHE